MVNLSMRALSKTRIARPMRKAPVVVYLQHPWAALRPSRYAFPKRFNDSLFEPPSCFRHSKSLHPVVVAAVAAVRSHN